MSNAPLMPMATAVWLVENTTLTFKQIADFCKLHEVEIQGIADGEVAKICNLLKCECCVLNQPNSCSHWHQRSISHLIFLF